MLYLIKPYHNWFIINIPRGMDNLDYLYPILEIIKDGKITSSKYEPRIVTLEETPHVVVFANCPPNETKLSKDRWCIRDFPVL